MDLDLKIFLQFSILKIDLHFHLLDYHVLGSTGCAVVLFPDDSSYVICSKLDK